MDAKTLELTVDVTAGDIAAGLPDHCQRCAVALALGRAVAGVPDVRRVDVDSYTLCLQNAHGRTIWSHEVSLAVAKFVTAFDNRQPVEPFTFTATFKAVQ